MNREELIQLRDAIDMTLALPDSIRALLAQWLAPEGAKPGNGLDPHPPPSPSPNVSTPKHSAASRRARQAKPFNVQTAERRLLAAMADNPNSTVIALAIRRGAAGARPASDSASLQSAERSRRI
jgi:hypothetical protein